MELERFVFPLLDETLNYLDNRVTGKVKNIVRNKSNKFVFHLSLDKCEQINGDGFHSDVINEVIIPLSNVKPGFLLACRHPKTKKWTRCYVISICHLQAYVAICDTGEITVTKEMKYIPDTYKNIPVITFEAELKYIYPYDKLQHLMEFFDEYSVSFNQFSNKPNYLNHKKMKLTHKNGSVDFIISKWNPQNYKPMDVAHNSLIKNGSAVVIAKVENYDYRHIFVRSIDQFVNICKQLQIYCETASNIERCPILGDIIAVKCVDKFYRGKIIDILDESNFALYLIDAGYVITTKVDCLVDLSTTLQKIPSTVCLVGLKDITMKPWNQETYLYISTLFENSTTMILEYVDFDSSGLDSVTLTVINNNEDVNEHLKELLKYAEDPQNHKWASNTVEDFNTSLKFLTNEIIPVVVNATKSGSQILSEHITKPLLPGSLVYMTGFVDCNEVYIKKYEDKNDKLTNLLYTFNEFCLSAIPISRPLVIGEIVGFESPMNKSFYRGKVLKQINNINYQIQCIDFSKTVHILPIFHVIEIPKELKIPSNIVSVSLKGLQHRSLNLDASKYISKILSECIPMIIDFSPAEHFTNVTLCKIDGNENVNEQLLKLLSNAGRKNVPMSDLMNKLAQENLSKEIIHSDNNSSKLKNGDLIYMTTFIDVHHIFVRKVKDETDDFFDFIESVNLYCSAETPIGKLPKLNDVIGAKSITDGIFYRAKLIKKMSDVSYIVHFIDYGIEEKVNLSNIVSLSTKFKEIPTTISLVKLKDIPFCKLNKDACEYVSLISENETLTIDYIKEDTNDVILKTSENQNFNTHLSMLLFGSNEKLNAISTNNKSEEITAKGYHIQSLPEYNGVSIQPGTVVYMTACVDLNEIYIRKLEDYNDEYHNFVEKVNEFCLSTEPINRPLVVGEIVGALSTLDDIFYRAKVLKQNEDTTYSVRFIDFGDIDNIPKSNLYELPKEFIMMPSTIIKITLKGIKSCALNKEASCYISNLLSTYESMTIDFDVNLALKDVTLTIINNNENLANILNKLLKDNIDNNNDLKNTSVTDDVAIQNITECTMPSDETNLLKNGDHVFITSYIDLNNIFVRKVNINDNEFQKFTERVNSYCCLGGNISESKPLELDEIVGAKSSDDGCFYRGRIIEKTDDKNYGVLFIDFGFEACVNITDIVPLPIQLQQVRSYVSLVCLKGLRLEELNKESQTYLDNLILYNDVMKIEFEDFSAVTLTVVNQGQNVVDYLNGLCADNTIMDNTMTNNPVQGTLLPYGIEYISPDINIPQIPLLTNKSIVTIYAFISLNDISVSVVYNQLEMSRFLNDFSVFCMTSQPITRSPSIGEVFGVRSIDGSFNRGQIIEILNENQFKVIFFDFGTEEIVSANSIIEISEQLKQVPKIIYPVGLKNVNFENLNAQALSYVNMLCENMPLIIEFDENNPNGLKSVMLTTVLTQQNVNNHLVILLTEKEERDSPETVQMLNKGDIVYISSFVDLQSINVRRINNGTDKFKSFLEKFSSCCALKTPSEKEPIVGEIVAAKVENENKFYRAEVISRVDNEHYNVCFVDFGTWATVNSNNIVQPSDIRLQSCPTFMVSLNGFYPEPKETILMQYIKEISQLDTFIIDSITEDHKVTLISVKTKCNINDEIQKLIVDSKLRPKFQNDPIDEDMVVNLEEFVVTYYKPLLEVPIQIWIAEKISVSRYLVHTYDSRVEYMRLEKQIFNDSKTFELVKSIKTNMPCIAYFCPNWYRGEILEVVNKTKARVRLIDIGNIVIRNIKEIFCMPSKYKGKSLLVNIELQPEPQEKLPITTFKIVPKKHLDNITIAEVMAASIADQSYSDLESVGLPSFTSTPIPHEFDTFQFNDPNNMFTDIYQYKQISVPCKSNMLTIKDINYAKWFNGSFKLLTFLIVHKDCLVLRDHKIEETLEDLETKIQDFCKIAPKPYSPAENELCLAKFSDGLWYRAMCIKTEDSLNENLYTVYYLDWGEEYSVGIQDICEMSKEFVYFPATAHKCYIPGVIPSEWNTKTTEVISQLILTQVDCKIIEKLSSDSYTISCDIIQNLIDANSH